MTVCLIEPNDIHEDAIEALRQNGLKVIAKDKLKPEDKDEILALFVRTYVKVDKDLLGQFPCLKYVLRAGVGLDNIDLHECEKRKIRVINAPASNANAVAEYVVGVMVILLRNIPNQTSLLLNGQWRSHDLLGQELKAKTIGLVGCGAVGKTIAQKLTGFEVKEILGYDPYVDAASLQELGIHKRGLEELLKESDVVTLQLPLTEETRDLITIKELVLMKPSGYLINVGRGGIVNEMDLVKAIEKKAIKGAAMDVFENEPKVNKKLMRLENVILTPHIAGFTKESEREMAMMPVRKLLDLVKH